jgi:hypothetical protein
MHVSAREQLPLNFEPGLTVKFRTLEDCCAHVVHSSREGVDGVAGYLDMAPSELSRRLNAHLPQHQGDTNNRPLRVGDFVGIIAKTKDLRPVLLARGEVCQRSGRGENTGARADRAIHADADGAI